MDEPADNASLQLRCPAKLNLTLAVGAPRDDGLHPIASVMVGLNFGDDLQLNRLATGPSTFARRFADNAPKPQPIDWPIESDLIFRAHAIMEQHVGRALPVVCQVDKRIPAGAGLGGGSSNAAAMLVGLRRLFDLSIEDDTLLEVAQDLGADVVFLVRAILGQTAALVTGIGEVIKPLNNIPSFDCVLVFPDGQCPTPAVYRAFDQLSPSAFISEDLIQTWSQSRSLPAAHNDLLDAAIEVCPAITLAIKAITGQEPELEAQLTGSGSALFAMTKNKPQAIAIAEAIQKTGIAACPACYSALS